MSPNSSSHIIAIFDKHETILDVTYQSDNTPSYASEEESTDDHMPTLEHSTCDLPRATNLTPDEQRSNEDQPEEFLRITEEGGAGRGGESVIQGPICPIQTFF